MAGLGEHHGVVAGGSSSLVRAGRRWQWIKPFYKGSEMADLVSKPYLVREQKMGTE